MEKKSFNWHGKTYYFLGKDKGGINYYLQQPSWDCGWYWGFGYINSFTNNSAPSCSRDISSHQHFDSLFLSGDLDSFKNMFEETPLSKNEVWTLMELMQTFYDLRRSAELFGRGGTHIANNPLKEQLRDSDFAKHINEDLIPQVTAKVIELLTK